MDILRARSVARGLGTLFGLIRGNGPLVLVFDPLLLLSLSLLSLLTARLRITWPSHAMDSRNGLLVSGFKRPAVNRTSPQADTDSHGRYQLQQARASPVKQYLINPGLRCHDVLV